MGKTKWVLLFSGTSAGKLTKPGATGIISHVVWRLIPAVKWSLTYNVDSLGVLVLLFPIAAVTNYHKLNGLKQQIYYLIVLSNRSPTWVPLG